MFLRDLSNVTVKMAALTLFPWKLFLQLVCVELEQSQERTVFSYEVILFSTCIHCLQKVRVDFGNNGYATMDEATNFVQNKTQNPLTA